MEQIPNITFKEKKNTEIGFDIMSLQSLLERAETLDFPIYELHRIGFHQLMLITKGRGDHVIDFEPYQISKGDFLFVNKEQIHAFGPKNERDGYVILFTDQFLNRNLSKSDYFAFYRFFSLSKYPPVIGFTPTELSEMLPVIKGMEREFKTEDDFAKEEIIRSMLKIVLLSAERIARQNIQQPQSAEFKTFVAFQKLLAQEFTNTRDAKNYAAQLNISYRHLNEICKEFTQKTAKAVIDGFIILEAKRKLFQPELPIKEISYSMGFDEPTNFVKYFKSHTGVSPKIFRSQVAK